MNAKWIKDRYGLRYRDSKEWQSACKPVAPKVAGVLRCMLDDAQASHMSFRDWCADFGYDEDSRKALATYEACQQEGDKLNKVFTREQQSTLNEYLQDY